MSKPVVQLRRFITRNREEEAQPYPANSEAGGGTVTYELEIVGTIEGLNNTQTEIVIQSIITATNMQMIQGTQTAEVARKVRLMRRPYLSTLKALAEPDQETLDLLEF